jgi:hypothetical protein
LSDPCATVATVESPCAAYCPDCNVRLGGDVRYAQAVSYAQTHATVTGHPVHVVDARSWSVLETVSGEPSLPLWDSEEM